MTLTTKKRTLLRAAKPAGALGAFVASLGVLYAVLAASGTVPTTAAASASVSAEEPALGPGARVLDLRANPLAGVNAAAPERLAYDLPEDRIVQLGPEGLTYYLPSAPVLNKARLAGSWTLLERWEEANTVGFDYPDGSVRYRRDLRQVPINAHGLPDLSDRAFAERLEPGAVRLRTHLFNDASRDPDWARWLAGRYAVVAEYPADETLTLTVSAAGKATEVSAPARQAIGDGHVRETWLVDAPLALDELNVEVAGGDTGGWRRFAIYQTHDVDGRPTGDRARHEAGNVWSARYLDLFATRYNAVRFMDLVTANASAETHLTDRCGPGDQGTWVNATTAMPFFGFPWDAARYLGGEHCAGMPIQAMMRLTLEASLAARAAGAEGHVVNPQAFVPERYEMDQVDEALDVIAASVAEARAAGVAYDYVKLEVGNEIWNHHPGGFRDDHCFFAGYPKTRFWRTEERDPRYVDEGDRFAATDPWYADWDQLQADGCVNGKAAMAGAARRMVHVLSRAHARHPDVNWIGGYSGWSVVPYTVRHVFEGARDGAADVAAWAAEGDERGDHAYAVVPDDDQGRPAVGSLFVYSLTSYYNTLGGPKRGRLAGLPHWQVSRMAEEGTLDAYIRDAFLTQPAEPQAKGDDRALYDTLAGMRVQTQAMIDAVAAEGGAMIDFYEGGDHTLEPGDWPEETRAAFRAWKQSETYPELMDAVNAMTAELGVISATDYGHVVKNEDRQGTLVKAFPWREESDPFRTDPWERIWAKRMEPLAPAEAGGSAGGR